jgi:ubiquinone/menaquinone biosynthesis C-methylase UbiE
VRAGRIELRQGTAEGLPFAADTFDGVYTINTIYFWDDPPACASEIARVLKPGGRLVIGFRPRSVMEPLAVTRQGFTHYEPEKVRALFEEAGFEVELLAPSQDAHLGFMTALATKRRVPAEMRDGTRG